METGKQHNYSLVPNAANSNSDLSLSTRHQSTSRSLRSRALLRDLSSIATARKSQQSIQPKFDANLVVPACPLTSEVRKRPGIVNRGSCNAECMRKRETEEERSVRGKAEGEGYLLRCRVAESGRPYALGRTTKRTDWTNYWRA